VTNEDANVRLISDPPATSAPEIDVGTLEALMEQYQRADQAATRALIERVTPKLVRFFRYQGARPDQAEDLAQDTWLRIHRVRHTYRLGEPLLPWVFAIARRVRVDHFRRNLRATVHEVSSSVLPDTAAGASDPGLLSTVSALTAALPASQREVVVMLKTAGMSIEEVARATGSTVGSVKQKAHRAYGKLRALLLASPQPSKLDGGAE
jgi:RNA polymerase sigma-70 factor (ECF subfamily)